MRTLLAGGVVLLFWAAGSAVCGAGETVNPHLNSFLNPGGCRSCHEGHGASRSPMLGSPQSELCERCHGSRSDQIQEVIEGNLNQVAHPPRVSEAFSRTYTHPLSPTGYSRYEPNQVVCTSCHSPHRSMAASRIDTLAPTGGHLPSPRDPARLEYELCQECHGMGGSRTYNLSDVSRLLDLSNRSYHPVQGSAQNSSPSLPRELQGQIVNCTDCHGNDDPEGPQGPHGSSVRFLLRKPYSATDVEESPTAYALCYACHGRAEVLSETSPFPLHLKHVVDSAISCATCHSAHGSVSNRALIRFGEEAIIAAVGPSGSGQLRFDSSSEGAGQCYLSCHGVDHDPKGYGAGMESLRGVRRFGSRR